ncbi:hypothetical protein POPTR_018G144960v4 [Populus trichocarpa]|uniref:Uncharacterized protein n=1 Tax=Populus trichocarpa TaxID=3694 RepID=A0ACC0RQR8_POPTR|nr:hypothetical protein POPTR_018G144960v4 [Populus trichocarpa]
MSIKADPTYEFTYIFFSKTSPSTHLPKPKSPHPPRTFTSVISSGSNPSSLISINNQIASLAKPILEYPEIIEFHDTKSLSPISSNTFRANPISPHLASFVVKE